jgi:hypothetical protein
VVGSRWSFIGGKRFPVVGAAFATLLTLFPSGFLTGGVTGAAAIPVSITSSADPADAGLPFTLTANVPGPVGEYFYNWTDSLGDSDAAPTWDVLVHAAGTLSVTLIVTDPAGDRGVATLSIVVVPAPTLTLSAPYSQVDVAVPTPFFLQIGGGVPPYTASWTASSGGANGSAGWTADGNHTAEVTFSQPGPAWILARVVDALGDSSGTAELVTEVVPSGSIMFAPRGPMGEVAWPMGAVVVIENGAPPFRWSLSSSLSIASGVSPFGVFPSDGTYQWNLSFASPGTEYLNLTTVDALGAVDSASTQVTVEPPLSANLTLPGGGAGTAISLDAVISGGLPPYAYQFQLSEGATTNGSLVAAGTATATFDSLSAGGYSVELRVRDALGQTWVSTQEFNVMGGAPPLTEGGSGDLSLDGGLLGVLLAILVAGFYTYRRLRKGSGAPPPTGASALPTVRQLMEQSQVIDRETLLLLAEEAGESTSSVESALRVLIHSGEVTSESGSGPDEVLRWTSVGPTPATPEGLP